MKSKDRPVKRQLKMSGPQNDVVMFRSRVLLLLVTFSLVLSVTADKEKLLKKLKDEYFPWFGQPYKKKCPNSQIDWPNCYNLRPNVYESIIQRAGLADDTSLTTELEVVFSAPEENVDVCGVEEHMPEVKKFTLHEDGIPTDNNLRLGAEIYRNQPKVNWDAKEGLMYTLIFWDVGFFKIRGWFYNIELKGSELLGLTNSPYYPPANPTPNINPILIMLLEQTGSTTSKTNEIMTWCVETIPNPQRAKRCRDNVIKWLKVGLNLVGLHVYYTKGASLYERFRACTESFICENACTEKFNGFFQANELIKGRLNSMGNDQKDLDFYVNFRFTGVSDKTLVVHCCSEYLRKKFEYRPRPGNEDVLTYVGLVDPQYYHSRMTLEMSGPVTALQETELFYTVVIVDLESDPHCSLHLQYIEGNLQYPGESLEMREKEGQTYERPYPSSGHHIYAIILFSHKGKLHRIPHFSRCNFVRDLNSHMKPSIRSVSYFTSSSFLECRRFRCPAVPGEENPFSLIGAYKAASDFKQTTVKTNSGDRVPINSILILSATALFSFCVILELLKFQK